MYKKMIHVLAIVLVICTLTISSISIASGSSYTPPPKLTGEEWVEWFFQRYGFYPDQKKFWDSTDNYYGIGLEYGLKMDCSLKGDPYNLPLSKFEEVPSISRPIQVLGLTKRLTPHNPDNPFKYESKEYTFINMRTTQKTKLYTYATKQSKVVASLPKYAQCELVNFMYHHRSEPESALLPPVWCLVKYNDQFGWIIASQLFFEDMYDGYIETSSAYLYSKPSSSKTSRVTKLEPYSFVRGKYAENGFFLVETSGTWMPRIYLDEIDPSWRTVTHNGTVYYETVEKLEGYVPVKSVWGSVWDNVFN